MSRKVIVDEQPQQQLRIVAIGLLLPDSFGFDGEHLALGTPLGIQI
jgi:hypothetical protein